MCLTVCTVACLQGAARPEGDPGPSLTLHLSHGRELTLYLAEMGENVLRNGLERGERSPAALISSLVEVGGRSAAQSVPFIHICCTCGRS
jgi:hypothetical protein